MSDLYPSNKEVREWAKTKTSGHLVPDRGRLPKMIIQGWNRAHPDRPYVASKAWHGTWSGYAHHNCRCDLCCEAASERGRNYYDAGGPDRWNATARRPRKEATS